MHFIFSFKPLIFEISSIFFFFGLSLKVQNTARKAISTKDARQNDVFPRQTLNGHIIFFQQLSVPSHSTLAHVTELCVPAHCLLELCSYTTGFCNSHFHKSSIKRTFKWPRTKHSLEKEDSFPETSFETSILKTISQLAHLSDSTHCIHSIIHMIIY